MRRGVKKVQDNALQALSKAAFARMVAVIGTGLVVSGCVATALTPLPVTLPATLASTDTETQQQSDDQQLAVEGSVPEIGVVAAEEASESIELPENVAIPLGKPVGNAAVHPSPTLVKTENRDVPAEKANSPAQTVAAAPASVPTQADTTIETAKPAVKAKNPGFLASLFQSRPKKVVRRPTVNSQPARPAPAASQQVALVKPVGNGDLPGVRKRGLFGIQEAREGPEEGYSPVRTAFVGGLARTSPNGLRVQTSRVQVACLRPGVIEVLNKVQRRFGRVPIITSGYRSPGDNRRARGARNSAHIYCKAADIQVTGVSKWELAKYLRSIPGRGGVGTYCSTKSVHFDIGSKRDWNWRCRRGKRSAKRK